MRTNSLFKKLDREKDIISIEKFIINYLHNGEEIYFEKMGHHDLRKYNSIKVLRVSYDFALENFDLLKRGTILMVKDDYNKIVPYINPIELDKILTLSTIEEEIATLEQENLVELDRQISHLMTLECLTHERKKIEETINLLLTLNRADYLDNIINQKGGEYDKHKRKSKVKCFKP